MFTISKQRVQKKKIQRQYSMVVLASAPYTSSHEHRYSVRLLWADEFLPVITLNRLFKWKNHLVENILVAVSEICVVVSRHFYWLKHKPQAHIFLANRKKKTHTHIFTYLFRLFAFAFALYMVAMLYIWLITFLPALKYGLSPSGHYIHTRFSC